MVLGEFACFRVFPDLFWGLYLFFTCFDLFSRKSTNFWTRPARFRGWVSAEKTNAPGGNGAPFPGATLVCLSGPDTDPHSYWGEGGSQDHDAVF